MSATLALCLVASIHDGDSIRCIGKAEAIRIAGIQAPDFETSTPCRQRRSGYDCSNARATRSRDFLTGILRGRTITYRKAGKASYGRTVAHVFADGFSVAPVMVSYGYARRWP